MPLFELIEVKRIKHPIQWLYRARHLERATDRARRDYQKHAAARKEHGRLKRLEYRAKVLNYYGAYCHCNGCDESENSFLVIHHVNEDGAKHRREEGIKNIYQWLCVKFPSGKFPDNLTVLCANCNGALEHYGYCPHNKETDVQN